MYRYLMLLSIVLAALFSTALLISTILLPTILCEQLSKVFPDYWFMWEKAENFINIVRPVGHTSLAVVIVLIVVGFILKKWKISFLGSLILYLPTFSYFASTMFFLASIGVLRVLWFPLIDLMPGATWSEKVFNVRYILELGSIVYLPYDISVFIVGIAVLPIFLLINPLFPFDEFWEVFFLLSFFVIILIGVAIFFIATINWFYGKFTKQNIVTWGIYRYSRHPQYLGFILWSYGLLIYDTYVFKPVKGGYFASPSIIWLTVVMIIIAIALYEENHMVKIYEEKYIQYMSRTPFLIPLPKKLENILTYPAKLILKNNRPQKPLEYLTVFLTYYIILILLSLAYNTTKSILTTLLSH
ncbi:MAG: DUF1295 domain-containing protein [Desulfurococcaceae archaeon]|nr:DUF1295 domain-containing protein [Desulfurococcaceae archaeon]